jgi:hypothetical protein
MYHCHLLLHEDKGMMGQFLVLAPGQPPAPMTMPMTGMDHSGMSGEAGMSGGAGMPGVPAPPTTAMSPSAGASHGGH